MSGPGVHGMLLNARVLIQPSNRDMVAEADIATVLALDPTTVARSCYFVQFANEPWWAACASLDDFDTALNSITSLALAAITRSVISELASSKPRELRHIHPYHVIMSDSLHARVAEVVVDRMTTRNLLRNAGPVTTTLVHRNEASLKYETLVMRVEATDATLRTRPTQPPVPPAVFHDPFQLRPVADLIESYEQEHEPFANTRAPY